MNNEERKWRQRTASWQCKKSQKEKLGDQRNTHTKAGKGKRTRAKKKESKEKALSCRTKEKKSGDKKYLSQCKNSRCCEKSK